jgi:predicted Zn-dependent protease
MVKKIFVNSFGIAALVLFSGCATLYNPATGRNEFIFINSATEGSIGQNVVYELTKKQPLSKNSVLQNRVRAIGNRVEEVCDRKDIKYSFAVLSNKELNAVTFPGGYIFINEGLIKILNENELAYVLGHEVGHTAARHIAKKMQANMAYQLLLGLAFIGIGDNAGGVTQNIAKGTDAIYSMVELSYSRKDEFQADTLAVKYASKAGFDPYASLSALEKIKKGEGPNWKIMRYFRTHPYVDERIKALRVSIPELNRKTEGQFSSN